MRKIFLAICRHYSNMMAGSGAVGRKKVSKSRFVEQGRLSLIFIKISLKFQNCIAVLVCVRAENGISHNGGAQNLNVAV
jgi:hypothetical protein